MMKKLFSRIAIAIIFLVASSECSDNRWAVKESTHHAKRASERTGRRPEGSTVKQARAEKNLDYSELRRSLADQVRGMELSEEHLFAHPILPDDWPPNNRVRVYMFRMDILPTGMVKYRIWTADRHVSMDLETRKTEVHTFRSPEIAADSAFELSDEVKAALRDAEEALLAACAGHDPESLRGKLGGYRRWLDAAPYLKKEITAYAPGFFAWLESGSQGR